MNHLVTTANTVTPVTSEDLLDRIRTEFTTDGG
jgi:hypothetical protein